MRTSARVSISILLLVALLSVAITGCRRAKPPQAQSLGVEADTSVARVVSTTAAASPTSRTPDPSPTVALPTATSIAVSTPTIVVPIATANLVPTAQMAPTDVPQATPVSDAPLAVGADATEEVSYTVKWGDSLWALAGRFDTTIASIASLNGLTNTDFIRVGQTLIVQTVASSDPVTHGTYVVRQGDSLSVIGQRYGASVEELRRINQIVNPWFIYVGQTLMIPSDSTQGELSETRYVVLPGDTLWHVAIRYGTTVWRIRIMNNIRNPNLIYPGQVVIVP